METSKSWSSAKQGGCGGRAGWYRTWRHGGSFIWQEITASVPWEHMEALAHLCFHLIACTSPKYEIFFDLSH